MSSYRVGGRRLTGPYRRSITLRRRSVHPRSRGEHEPNCSTCPPNSGSSPLARGTRAVRRARRARRRFIPARAGNTRRTRSPYAHTSVHPRSRGEHQAIHAGLSRNGGSSPLARGTRGGGDRAARPGRFIPARAGNTRATGPGCSRRSVHPRSRGEHPGGAGAGAPDPGSSPLARGTRGAQGGHDGQHRFIPARAGNTTASCTAGTSPAVHPRSRGEHMDRPSLIAPSLGSSPLARGTRAVRRARLARRRFIPARAGNTRSAIRRRWCRPVHPRSRGEHPEAQARQLMMVGSSPLARGTPRSPSEATDDGRFIPARAGNTAAGSRAPRPNSVHPRSRGEHFRTQHRIRWGGGSSPLARGTPHRARLRGPDLRFIPARAGNTAGRRPTGSSSSVHPRSRGEHHHLRDRRALLIGSSPLARGTPDRPHWGGIYLRFIPARAGNTMGLGGRDVSARGSSPLARGTRGHVERERLVIRFIPARAGNTPTPPWRPSSRPVHPRSRGEHRDVTLPVGAHHGSSPLARGTRYATLTIDMRRRFIPARAGNTSRR